MRERVGALVGGVSRAMWVMTFHSACARILRAEAPRLGYKRAFTIYDEADSVRMVKRCLERARARPEALPAARDQGGDLGGQEPAHRRRPTTRDAVGTGFEQTVADVYDLYERRMLEASAMDFDDLLVRTVNLLELFADVREKYRRIFRQVLVDEYQDTNRAQYRLLQLLDRGAPQPDRGRRRRPVDLRRSAAPTSATSSTSSATSPTPTIVQLEQNYRSTQTILDAANAADRPQREPQGEAPLDRRRRAASRS